MKMNSATIGTETSLTIFLSALVDPSGLETRTISAPASSKEEFV